MADFIVVAAIAIVVGAAIIYIIKEKKRGTKCIGCPAAGTCTHHCSSCGGGCMNNGKDSHTDNQ